jgi:hypothetical protein
MIRKAMLAYATGRASHRRQVKGDDPDEQGYPGPPGWGLGMKLTTSPCKKKIVMKPQKNRGGQGPHRAVKPMIIMMTSISY